MQTKPLITMGNIITKEERDLLAKLRAVAGDKVEGMTDDQLLQAMEQGRKEVLQRAAIMATLYSSASGGSREFNVFVENLEYGRIITKVRLNEDNITAFVVEMTDDGDTFKYWCDIDQLSGPELMGIGDRFQLLLDTLSDEAI